MIYFDNAATAFHKPPEVEEAVIHAFHTIGNSGRGAYDPTLNAARLIYDTRQKLAGLFGITDPTRIAFTANATESLNIAIQGLIESGDHVITTVCEHNSVLRPLYLMEKQGTQVTYIKADAYGRLDYDELERSTQPNTKAVVITHASNLTGNVTDIKRVSALTKRHSILLIVDASQTAGTIPIHVEEMGIDVLCFTGHKGLMGPQGTGGIYVKEDVQINPFKVGGSGFHSFDKDHPSMMPTALEAGTLNGHGIAGLGAALSFIEKVGIHTIHSKESSLAKRFIEGIQAIDEIKLYGDLEASERAAIVSLNIGNMDSALVSDILWEDYEICVRAGAHCAPLMHEALGTVEQGTVRFSFSYFNTEEEVDKAIKAIHEIACE